MICSSAKRFLFIVRLHLLGRTLNLSGGNLQWQVTFHQAPLRKQTSCTARLFSKGFETCLAGTRKVNARRVGFLQGDVTRAIKGAVAAGLEPGQVEIRPDGTILVSCKSEPLRREVDELEQWETSRRARKA
jgi:hypothetical protein